MVVDWGTFGGGVVVEYVFLLRGQEVVGRSWNTEGPRYVVVTNLYLSVALELVDSGFDGTTGGFVGDGLASEDCFTDEAILDLIEIRDVLIWRQEVAGWNRDLGRYRWSLQSKAILEQASCGCWRVEVDRGWCAIRLTWIGQW